MDIARYERLWSSNWQTVQAIGPLTHTRYRLLSALLPQDLRGSPAIIDIGCGNGAYLSFLQGAIPGVRLCGIEPTVAGKAAADPAVRHFILTGTVAEVAARLRAGTFDVVICSEVLEHVDDPEGSLRIIYSLLRPGGRALMTVPGGMRHWSSQDEVAGHLRRFEFDEFRQMQQEVGFEVTEQYGWGGPFASVYNHLVSNVGPERVMQTQSNPLIKAGSRLLSGLFRVDDWFKSKRGFQLVSAATRPFET